MIVTISASYGAGGSELGPRIASRLGVRFVDRAIPVQIADDLGISVEDAEALESNAPSPLWNFFARMSLAGGLALPSEGATQRSEAELIEATEAHLRRVVGEGSAVILGHAAAVVLADHPDILHVRLDGSPEGRVQAAMRQHRIDRDTSAAKQKDNDKIRASYVRHFYGVDPADPRSYHLVLDTVRLGWDAVERLIVQAAHDLQSARDLQAVQDLQPIPGSAALTGTSASDGNTG